MAAKKDTYVEGIGRRKTSTARVRLTPAKETTVTINGKDLKDYLPHESLQKTVLSVLDTEDAGIEHYNISVHVSGSGISAQAEAIRLAVTKIEMRTALNCTENITKSLK